MCPLRTMSLRYHEIHMPAIDPRYLLYLKRRAGRAASPPLRSARRAAPTYNSTSSIRPGARAHSPPN